MADQDARALLLTIQANTELLRSNLSAAERAIGEFTNQTQTHLDRSDARFEALGKSVEKLEGPLERLKAVGEGAFAFLVGESLISKGKEALEFAGNIQFMSTQIGVSTDFLQKFRYAASQSGASVEATDTALTKFSRSVGEAANGDAALVKLFNSLGVNVLDAGGKVRSVEGIFKDTADAIQKLPDPAQRTADTMTLLGRGAGALVPLLASGASGFNQLAAAADQLGVVLNPELIEHAEDVNHKMAALKLILDAQMASAVAQNAAAIGQLAGQFVSLAGGLAQFFSHNPREAFAILGGLAGLKFGGLPGAAIGAAGGAALGSHIDADNRAASLDRGVRSADLVKAGNAYQFAQNAQRAVDAVGGRAGGLFSGPSTFVDTDKARSEYIRQLALFRSAKAKGFAGHAEEFNLGSTAAGDHNPDITKPKTPRADHSAERAANNDRAYQAELQQAQDRYAKSILALADTAEGRYRIEVDEVDATKRQRDLEIDDQVKAKRISQAQADTLKALNAETVAAQKIEASRKEQAANIDLFYAAAAREVQNQVDLLQLDDRLATTRKERLAIELKLLDYQQQQAIAAQQQIIDRKTSTPAQRDAAQNTIENIGSQADRNRQLVTQQNESPIDAYRRQLRGSVGDANAVSDSFQNVAVKGLQGLEEQLAGTVGKVLGLKGAFGELASSIIADLARIEIERAILGALGGGSGGLLGSLFGGGKASGGDIDPSKFYLVGENGPELFAPGASGTIIPNGAIKAPSIGPMTSAAAGRQTVDVHATVNASPLLLAHVEQVSVRTTAAAAQPIMSGATAQTMKKLNRQGLPGGYA